MIAMISGHLDLTVEEFQEHYSEKIKQAIEQGHKFVVGDARGADAMAQRYLVLMRLSCDIDLTVYHMFTIPRNNWGTWKTKGGFTKDDGKDSQMTTDSDYDIAWVRPEKHSSVSGRVSGTEANIVRRKAKAMKP